jgi:ribosomal protein L11 methyltransferase
MHYTKAAKKVFEVSAFFKNPQTGSHEILKSIFVNCGFALPDIIEQDIDGRTALAVYCPTRLEASVFEKKLKHLGFPGLTTVVTVLYQDDWLTRWKKDWKPFGLTRSIDVVPVWCLKDYKAGRRDHILLDTVSSFGTGLHETTRFMAEFIDGFGAMTRVLDVGTGTGILALVAIKCGARDVWAIDVDDMCINAAQANFEANGFSGRAHIIHSDLAKFTPSSPFDYVCANLVTHDLIHWKKKILSFVKPGGRLAVSGISLENLPKLREAFASLPLRCVKIKKGKQWAAVLFKRM